MARRGRGVVHPGSRCSYTRTLSVCLLLIVAGLSACGRSWANPSAPPIDLSRYEMTFEDRFQDLSIAGAPGLGKRWYSHTPWNGDFGDAQFVGPGPDGPFVSRHGGLSIVARQDANGRWTSGLISSRDRDGPQGRGFAQQYGYFEIKARLPEGGGTWPAFWLIGVDKSSSASEIDVMEFYGGFPGYFHATAQIWNKQPPGWVKPFLIRIDDHILSTQYNTFGVDIDPVNTNFYFNGHVIASVSTPAEYRQPFYLLADLGLGGGWPTKDLKSPQSMDIEYIRAYRRRTA